MSSARNLTPKNLFVPREEEDQIIVADYLNYRGILWLHPPNGEKRTPWRGAKLKRMGVLAGAADIIILEPPPLHPDARGVLIELKRQKGGVVSEAQMRFFQLAEPIGWMCKVAFGADEALKYLHEIGW